MISRRTCIALSLLLATPAVADNPGLQSCRAIKDPAARLACYDRIPLATTPTPAAAPRTPAPAAGSASAPAPADQFGFESRRAPDVPNVIDSHIPGRFEGWYANDRITLANGQVWKIADGSQGALWVENPKVRVRRGILGTFFMEIEGTNRSPRVVREK